MKAVVFDQFGEPADVLQVREADVPQPGPGQLRVRMLASPVNPSDLLTVRGAYGVRPDLPFTPGYEGAGVIDEAGPGLLKYLRGLSKGDKVAVLGEKGGNWSEFVLAPADRVVPVGDLDDAAAATFFVNPATAYVMTREVLRVGSGDWLLQTAAGSALGKMVQRLGHKYGFRVINVVRRPEQAEAMRQSGLTAVSGGEGEIVEQVKQLTGGKGVRHAIDAVGGKTAAAAVECLAPGGRLLVYGLLSGEDVCVSPRWLIANGSSVEGFWLARWSQQAAVWTMLNLFSKIRGLMREGVLTTEVEEFPLDQVRDAVRKAEEPGRSKKVLLRIGSAS